MSIIRRHTRWPRDWSSDLCSSDHSPPMPRIVPSLHAYAAAISSRARQRTVLHGPADVYEEEDDERAHKEMARTARRQDRKSTRLNSSHVAISYGGFCLKKNNREQ